MSTTQDWRQQALAATQGTQTGAILECALRCASLMPDDRPLTHPCFVSFASVTSDGYLMCTFTDRNGEVHLGAFVGEVADLEANIAGLAKHLWLSEADRTELLRVMRNWIVDDHGARKGLHPRFNYDPRDPRP